VGGCILLKGFHQDLLDGRLAVSEAIVEFVRESVEGAVSVAFCCMFSLPVCLLISFDVKVAWDPSYSDAQVAESFLATGKFGMEDVEQVAARSGGYQKCG
jgi:hypothetical protein